MKKGLMTCASNIAYMAGLSLVFGGPVVGAALGVCDTKPEIVNLLIDGIVTKKDICEAAIGVGVGAVLGTVATSSVAVLSIASSRLMAHEVKRMNRAESTPQIS